MVRVEANARGYLDCSPALEEPASTARLPPRLDSTFFVDFLPDAIGGGYHAFKLIQREKPYAVVTIKADGPLIVIAVLESDNAQLDVREVNIGSTDTLMHH
ncbi:hypothetical protein AGR4C_Lc80056 [Agrobacterium tumefaciens str. Kerr 14]|uniref:Uncharacterized protein n=1 Tax=Agrobacterium tumefaciens str. Kerr 14 TaxID=1183424 RepID=A0A1S7S3W3_AGRTU|nr:hypothetical protein AGR4C_Lc80056 [Agrobacterium tumefaciens str. Kerr 14]